MDVITPSLTNLQIIVNFNKMLENVNFSTVICTLFISNTHPINRLSNAGAALVNTISSARQNGFFSGNFPLRISEQTGRERKCLFRKLHILILQTADFHFANNRSSFRKLQTLTFRQLQFFISQTTDFHFVSFHLVSQTTVSLENCRTKFNPSRSQSLFIKVCCLVIIKPVRLLRIILFLLSMIF